MPLQVGDPFAVLDVGLATGHLLDVRRVPDDDLERPLEDRVHRHPITPVLSMPTSWRATPPYETTARETARALPGDLQLAATS